MTVGALRAEMSAGEWRQWMTWYKLKHQREELERKKADARK